MINYTTSVTSAYLQNNPLPAGEIPSLIRLIHQTLSGVTNQAAAPQEPAVPIRKSVTPHAIICLDCGKATRTLKRHIAIAHGLSVHQYRAKWNLPASYPMVAAEHAEVRSQLAKRIGLGQMRRKDVKTVSAIAEKTKSGRP